MPASARWSYQGTEMTSTNRRPRSSVLDEHVRACTHPFDRCEVDTARSCRCSVRRRSMFERGAGTELWDTDGKRYLDFLAGSRSCPWARQPGVAAAIAEQAETLWHVSNLFTNPVADAAREQNQRPAPRRLRPRGQVFFTNSGAEANECASSWPANTAAGAPRGRQRARKFPRTHAGDAGSHGTSKHEPFQPMPDGFRHVAWNDLDAKRAAVDARWRQS